MMIIMVSNIVGIRSVAACKIQIAAVFDEFA